MPSSLPPQGVTSLEYAGSLGIEEDSAIQMLQESLCQELGMLPNRIRELLVKRCVREHQNDTTAAAQHIRASLSWRSTSQHRDGCKICRNVQHGAHPMRQIGFDRHGRPVIYCCFAQAFRDSNGFSGDRQHGHFWKADNFLPHLTHILDNAALSLDILREIQRDQSNMSQPAPPHYDSDATLWVIDFTGLKVSDLKAVAALGRPAFTFLSAHFCLALGRVVGINTPAFFHGPWRLMSHFLPDATKRKVSFIGVPRLTVDKNNDNRSSDDPNYSAVENFLSSTFGDDRQTADWLREEIQRNRELDRLHSSQKGIDLLNRSNGSRSIMASTIHDYNNVITRSLFAGGKHPGSCTNANIDATANNEEVPLSTRAPDTAAIEDLRLFTRVRDQGADGFWRCTSCHQNFSNSSKTPSFPSPPNHDTHDPRGAPAYLRTITRRSKNSNADSNFWGWQFRQNREAETHASTAEDGAQHQPHPSIMADLQRKMSGVVEIPAQWPTPRWLNEKRDFSDGTTDLFRGRLRPLHRPDHHRSAVDSRYGDIDNKEKRKSTFRSTRYIGLSLLNISLRACLRSALFVAAIIVLMFSYIKGDLQRGVDLIIMGLWDFFQFFSPVGFFAGT